MTRRELMRSELGEGLGHFRQAAAHAAGGVGASVGPKLSSTREFVTPQAGRVAAAANQGWGVTMSAVTPLMVAARSGAVEASKQAEVAKRVTAKKIKESKMSRKRATLLVGLLAAGVAAGAAGAVIARRRSRAKWEEYESTGMDDATDEARSMIDSASSKLGRGADKAAGAAGRAGEKAAGWSDSAKGAVHTAKDKANDALHRGKSSGTSHADGFTDRATTAGKNGR
jgi:hypothetical protein